MLEVRIRKAITDFKLDVAFDIDQDILTILGPSGSGKTMTLHCIAGLYRPDEGYIKVNGRVLFDSAAGVNLRPQVRRVGFVFQNFALFQHLTVEQNVAYGIRERPRREVRDRVGHLLDRMGIARLGHRYPRQLSAGQQQRVAIARALAPEPEVLLLDEPFSALDSLVRERLQLELLSLRSFYKGHALFVTHDLTEGYRLGSRIAVYEAGRVVQCASKEEVIAAPANHTVARLVGFKNLLEGTVTATDGSSIAVNVPELGGVIKAMAQSGQGVVPGQKVTVGIRPEHIGLADAPGENVFPSTIDRVAEGVVTTNYYCHVNAVESSRHYLMTILSRHDTVDMGLGSTCLLHLPPRHVVLIKH